MLKSSCLSVAFSWESNRIPNFQIVFYAQILLLNISNIQSLNGVCFSDVARVVISAIGNKVHCSFISFNSKFSFTGKEERLRWDGFFYI